MGYKSLTKNYVAEIVLVYTCTITKEPIKHSMVYIDLASDILQVCVPACLFATFVCGSSSEPSSACIPNQGS